MAKFGCPETFIAIVREFHEGMQAAVQDNGTFSRSFSVSNGVKQGCVLAPTLFSMMFSAMLMEAFKNQSHGIDYVETVLISEALFGLINFMVFCKLES